MVDDKLNPLKVGFESIRAIEKRQLTLFLPRYPLLKRSFGPQLLGKQ